MEFPPLIKCPMYFNPVFILNLKTCSLLNSWLWIEHIWWVHFPCRFVPSRFRLCCEGYFLKRLSAVTTFSVIWLQRDVCLAFMRYKNMFAYQSQENPYCFYPRLNFKSLYDGIPFSVAFGVVLCVAFEKAWIQIRKEIVDWSLLFRTREKKSVFDHFSNSRFSP